MSLAVEYDPALLEAAVLCAVTGHPEEAPFRAARDPLYELDDGEEREAAFAALHVRWFERLGLAVPLAQALAEQPRVAAGCARCVVGRAVAARDEGADLRGAPPAPPVLLVRLRPETIADPACLLRLLRRELQHVADMLHPDFGYAPRPGAAARGLPDALLAARYRVLWDAWVDGRLVRQGYLPATARAERLRDFARAFPGLADRLEDAFDRFFLAARCTHAELLAFAAGEGAAPSRA